MMTVKEHIPVLLVDSKCAVCTGLVKFIRKHLGKEKILFRSLYDEEGKKYLRKYGFPENYDESVVYIYQGKAYIKSEAVLRVSRKMSGLYPVFSVFLMIPSKVRDYFYGLVAKHRHRL